MSKKWFAVSFFLLAFILTACLEDVPTSSNNDGQTPAIISIVADPIAIMPGDTSVVSVDVSNDDPDSISLTYQATGGTITGLGRQAIFIADSTEGVAWVTVTLDDGQGNASTGSATINVTQSIPIVSVAVELLESGSSANKCLVFSGVPSESLIFLRIQIVNPIDEQFEVIGDPVIPVLANQRFPLQLAGQCFTLHSGTYEFTFTLQRNQNDESFAFNTSYIQP